MRILVCGGRDFGINEDERLFVLRSLYLFAQEHSIYYTPDDNWMPSDIEIISGMAPGVDTIAANWAIVNWLRLHEFPANWEQYGKRAGYIRNKQMLEEGKPDVVLAFPGGKGTAMMVDIAKKAGVKVIEYKYNDEDTGC